MEGMEADYRYKQRIKAYNRTLMESTTISQSNKTAVQKFIDECYADGLSEGRIAKLTMCFSTILRLADPQFDLLSADKETLKSLVRIISEGTKINGEPLSEVYKSDLKVSLKKFYKVMQPTEDGDYPSKAKWIRGRIVKSKLKIPEPLTKEEIDRLIEVARNDRMRCMIKILAEGGIRAGELLSMKIKDVEFVEHGVKISVCGKTGPRKILLVESERYLRIWLSKHPFQNERNAPLWVTINGYYQPDAKINQIRYNVFRVLLKRIAVKAGIRLRRTLKGMSSDIRPHLFRHTRATQLATKLKEATMKEYFGWKQSSDMPATYIHLSGRNVDEEIMSMYGMKVKEIEDEAKECPRCLRINKGAQFCSRCSMPLTLEVTKCLEEDKEDLKKIIEASIEGEIPKHRIRSILTGKSL